MIFTKEKVLGVMRPFLSASGWGRILLVSVGSIVLSTCFLSMGALAFAEFVRPFKSVVEGTPTGPSGAMVPFGELGCVAVDNGEGGDSGDVWIGDTTNQLIDEFGPPNGFLGQLLGIPEHSCSFDDFTGKLISSGANIWVAADNSGGFDNGDVYTANAGTGETPGFVERAGPLGEAVDFSCSTLDSKEYIKGNKLIGRPEWNGKPGESWGDAEVVGADAVSSASVSAGDIYVVNRKNAYSLEVDVFEPSGCFVRAITGNRESTKNGKTEIEEVFVGGLFGVAIDPINGDVVIKGEAGGDSGWIIGEFTSSGEYLGKLTGRSKEGQFGLRDLKGGIAVNADGDLYVAVDEVSENEKREIESEKHVVDAFGEGAYYPGAVTGRVTGGKSSGAVTLNGVVRGGENNITKEDLVLSKCYFQYLSEEEFRKNLSEKRGGFSSLGAGNPGYEVPCVLSGGGDPMGQRLEEKNYGVSAEVGGLVPGRNYRFRLVAATNVGEFERGGVVEGENESFAAPGRPLVGGMSVGGVSTSFAEFRAEIDPAGADTEYWFEYVDGAGVSGVTQSVDIGSGDSGLSVVQHVGGLLPGTDYKVRVVARNAVGVTVGVGGLEAFESFETLSASPSGSSGRGYELVTPPNKGDAEDMFGVSKEELFGENFDVGYSSASGDEFLLFTAAAFGPFPAAGENAYVFSRHASDGVGGWLATSYVLPSLGVQSFASLVFGPVGFSGVAVGDIAGPAEKHVDAMVGRPGGPYTTVMESASNDTRVVGASQDSSHVVVESEDHVMPFSPLQVCGGVQEGLVEKQEIVDRNSTNLYAWVSGRQCLALVNSELAGGKPRFVSECGAMLGEGLTIPGGTHEAVSSDGSRIFFTAPDPTGGATSEGGKGCWRGSSCPAHEVSCVTPQVYMRLEEEGTVEGETASSMLEVSAPAAGVEPAVVYPSVFVGASEDGSRVFFVTRTELTADAVKAKTHDLELYECTVAKIEEAGKQRPSCDLTRVSRGESGDDEGDVEFVAAVSADGSTVYFDAGGKLTSGAPEGGGLYRYDTENGTTTYIAPGASYPETSPVPWVESPSIAFGEVGLNVEANYYATRDGRFLLFASSGNVTGYDSGGQRELYRYDADSPVSEGVQGVQDNPVCVSCNPNGAAPLVGSEFARSSVHFDNPAGGSPRGISEEAESGAEGGSDDGSYVFFDSAESLVPQATNGKINVYEWHEGTISLIGSGQDSSNSFFLDSSENGSNVFFGTHAQLVPQDTDTEGDLYDARICTAEDPCLKPPGESERECEGDACQSLVPEPAGLTPASVAFSGTSDEPNVPTPGLTCPKDEKLSRGKCVKIRKKTKRTKAKKPRKAAKTRGVKRVRGPQKRKRGT
jgi:hypothetical protein